MCLSKFTLIKFAVFFYLKVLIIETNELFLSFLTVFSLGYGSYSRNGRS